MSLAQGLVGETRERKDEKTKLREKLVARLHSSLARQP